MFVLSSDHKGAIAEAEIVAAAVRLDIPVLRPVAEHGRYDMAFEIGPDLLRVQCKWARLQPDGTVLVISLGGCYCTPSGYVRSTYSEDEIDVVAAYSGELDRCYLLPSSMVAGRSAVQLRLQPPKNGQRACINLASDYEFDGAVAQLEERRHGMAEVGGSSPPSSTLSPSGPTHHTVGSHQFRNHFGYWMERAVAGDEVLVTHRGLPRIQLTAVA